MAMGNVPCLRDAPMNQPSDQWIDLPDLFGQIPTVLSLVQSTGGQSMGHWLNASDSAAAQDGVPVLEKLRGVADAGTGLATTISGRTG